VTLCRRLSVSEVSKDLGAFIFIFKQSKKNSFYIGFLSLPLKISLSGIHGPIGRK
jgi:hypothetical protein